MITNLLSVDQERFCIKEETRGNMYFSDRLHKIDLSVDWEQVKNLMERSGREGYQR